MSPPRTVLGTGLMGIYDDCLFDTPEKVREAITLGREQGVFEIDTSRVYPTVNPGSCEQLLGQTNLKDIIIHTKVRSYPGDHTPEGLRASVNESLSILGVTQVRTMYLHMPDPAGDLANICRTMDEMHRQGKFERFGLSNYTIDQIHEIMRICESNGYVRPSIYQGQYNLLARKVEDELLPLLRKHGIAFEAYSPAAGGVLNKTSSRMSSDRPVGIMYQALYGKVAKYIDDINEVATSHGMTAHEAALRWIRYHSALDGTKGDGVVISASNTDQLVKTLASMKQDPLPEDLLSVIEKTWATAKPYAPPYTVYGSEIMEEYGKLMKDKEDRSKAE